MTCFCSPSFVGKLSSNCDLIALKVRFVSEDSILNFGPAIPQERCHVLPRLRPQARRSPPFTPFVRTNALRLPPIRTHGSSKQSEGHRDESHRKQAISVILAPTGRNYRWQ